MLFMLPMALADDDNDDCNGDDDKEEPGPQKYV